MSRPAQKADPAPVRMTTPQSHSEVSSSTWMSSSISSGLSAFALIRTVQGYGLDAIGGYNLDKTKAAHG